MCPFSWIHYFCSTISVLSVPASALPCCGINVIIQIWRLSNVINISALLGDIVFFCGCCHFERNYTWPHKHLPISRSLINFCPCRFGSRIEEPNAESRRTSYIKVRYYPACSCIKHTGLFLFWFILIWMNAAFFIFTHCWVVVSFPLN